MSTKPSPTWSEKVNPEKSLREGFLAAMSGFAPDALALHDELFGIDSEKADAEFVQSINDFFLERHE